MRFLKGSLREWIIAAILLIAGVALLHSRWSSASWASETSPDDDCGCECQ